MRNLCGRFGFVCWGMGLLAVGTAAQAGKPPLFRPPAERGTGNYGTTAQAGESPLFSLKAVKINPTCTAGDPNMLGQVCASDRQCDTASPPPFFDGVCSGDIAPTNTISASPGDIIVAEFFVSNWSPKGQRVKAYQVVIDDAGYFSGGGTLLPLGWDRPDVNIDCGPKEPCPPEFPVCLPQSVCAGVNHDPGRWAFTDKRLLEADFILAGCQIAGAEDTGTLSFRYGRAAFGSLTCTQAYIGEPKYAGTLVLKLGQDACGTFTLNFRPSSPKSPLPDETGLLDTNNVSILPLELEGLTIELGDSCPCRIVGSTPSDCTIDARQPSEPDGSSPAGWRSIDLEFDNPCASCDFALEGFGIREVTGGGDPSIFRVRCTDQNTLTVTFGGPISKDRWTCVEHFESNQEVCLGFLPGDSDGDQRADEADIVHLLDCLGGEASCADYQCDTDRSGRCTPADILREIDLLNGAEQYEEWLNESLPVLLGCP